METEFWLFLAVGFLAQIVDGALGMAYGVVSSTVLLAFGVPPATASASVHVAELFTTGASAASHVAHRNVDRRVFLLLVAGGIVGGALGAYALTSIDGKLIKPYIIAYLAIMGCYILYRAWKGVAVRVISGRWPAPLGFVGGFMDAIGGGGWGPTVTTTLVGAGKDPRKAIGTVNTAEFFVTVAISATFVFALLTGHWQDAGDLTQHAWAVGGLVVGGLFAAPLAGWVVKIVPPRVLTYAVGILIVSLSIYQTARLFKVLP